MSAAARAATGCLTGAPSSSRRALTWQPGEAGPPVRRQVQPHGTIGGVVLDHGQVRQPRFVGAQFDALPDAHRQDRTAPVPAPLVRRLADPAPVFPEMALAVVIEDFRVQLQVSIRPALGFRLVGQRFELDLEIVRARLEGLPHIKDPRAEHVVGRAEGGAVQRHRGKGIQAVADQFHVLHRQLLRRHLERPLINPSRFRRPLHRLVVVPVVGIGYFPRPQQVAVMVARDLGRQLFAFPGLLEGPGGSAQVHRQHLARERHPGRCRRKLRAPREFPGTQRPPGHAHPAQFAKRPSIHFR